jgi:hypothetical protein
VGSWLEVLVLGRPLDRSDCIDCEVSDMDMRVEDWDIGAELEPLLVFVDCDDWDLLASSELIIPGEGMFANFPVLGIAPIG